MRNSPEAEDSALAPNPAAPQQRPRPLPLFLDMLRRETAAKPERLARALEGLRKYQEAPRPSLSEPMPAVAEIRGAKLRDYGGSGPPVLFIPSLINPPNILDLSRDRSLLRWLSAQGHRPLLLDWGWDVAQGRSLSVASHVEDVILPLVRSLGKKPALAGYCLGGTMALAAAAIAPVRSVAAIAAPWHFSGFPREARNMLQTLWEQAQPTAEALGALPMEILQSAFWSLDPARTVAKFEAFAALDQESAEAQSFVTLEDWANDGPPIALAAAQELFEDFFAADRPGRGQWRVGGRIVDPRALGVPFLDIVSTTDRIVPAATAAGGSERVELALGHVGMVIGSRARQALWAPLAAWLSRTGGEC